MSPSLMEGDVVAWTPSNIEDIEAGDVIVFKSLIHWPDEKIVVHRVTKVLTDYKGRAILETKGDKNTWTDQAGPHIPEPYIREQNLMGKVLSIGQQPLKIPFIGYLGIWINQGLEMISQPTSSKESLSYIGIFSPLTISIILLVVIIFILPEKAKTEKEKLRFNMFGHRPLNLKRTILMFLIIYIVFLMIIHAFAYDSISSSVGVKDRPPDSDTNFGRVQPGKETRPQEFPLINPSIMSVKGIIFGKGEMHEFITRQTFQLERGEIKTALVKVAVPNGTANGSYLGEIALYSSPFWFLFSDDFILELTEWNSEATIIILDLLSAIFLTFVTFFILITFTFIGERITIFSINRSLQTPLKTVIKKRTVIKALNFRKNTKRKIGKGLGWIMRVDFSDQSSKETTFSKIGKPLIATLAIIPIIFLIKDQMLAMIFAVIIAGLIAYFLSCKIRNKIVLTVMFTMILSIIHMTINSNLKILSKEPTMLELMALLSGTIGIYILLFSLILIPLSLLSWYITRLFRNLKERKDPLLSLEGSCDL
jgi:signal peptidase